MSHLVKIQKVIDGVLQIENFVVDSFEAAKKFVEDKLEGFVRIFNDDGDLVHTQGSTETPLSTEQVVAITTTQVSAISTEQVAALSTEQVTVLTPASVTVVQIPETANTGDMLL